MKRRLLLAGLLGSFLPGHYPAARGAASAVERIPTPDGFVFAPEPLPAVQAAIRRRTLALLSIVGPVLSRQGSRDPSSIYPTQLVSRLSNAWPAVAVRSDLLPIARLEMPQFEQYLATGLARYAPALTIWGAGGAAAAHGDDLESFHAQLRSAVRHVREAGADLILMTPQYAPMVARLINLPPYRAAVLQEAQDAGVAVLDRYDLLRFWSENGVLDLDATDPAVQTSVARTVNEWIANLLADGIIGAVGPG